MRSINIRNAAIAGTVGVVIFMALMRLAPLSPSSSNVKEVDSLERQYDLKKVKEGSRILLDPKKTKTLDFDWLAKDEFLATSNGKVSSSTLVQLCASSAEFDWDSKAFAVLKKRMLAGKSEKEKEKFLETLDKLNTVTDELCEDGKPKQ